MWFCSQMFSYAKAFNQNIGKWNTAKVVDMAGTYGMFVSASAFNQNLAGWNTARVTTMFSVRALACASPPGGLPLSP